MTHLGIHLGNWSSLLSNHFDFGVANLLLEYRLANDLQGGESLPLRNHRHFEAIVAL